jgi:hypothetical protein
MDADKNKAMRLAVESSGMELVTGVLDYRHFQ